MSMGAVFDLDTRYLILYVRHRVSMVFITGIAFLAFAGAFAWAEEADPEAKVIEVVDGATIIVSYDGHPVSCVYIGVSAPESENPLASINTASRQFNRNLVEGKIVRLEFDEQKYDKYGRLLAYVYCDDVFVNAELIRQGYGFVMITSPNTRHAEDFLNLEAEARKSKRGSWAEPNTEGPAARSETSLERQIAIIIKRLDDLSDKLDRLLGIMRGSQPDVRSIPAAEHSPDQMKTEEQMDAGSAENQPDQIVYVTTSGKKYHKQGCRFLMGNYGKIAIEEAKRRKLTPCSFCFPKESR